MRTFALLLVIAVAVSALDTNKFAVLLQAGTRGNDAVESVYNLLRDLKTENVNVQAAADQKNNTDEEIAAQVIGDLTTVATLNKQNYDALTTVREDVEAKIKDSYTWINWAEGRLAEIANREEQLAEMRCYANGLFVKSLADHQDALNIVRLLKQDVAGFMTGTNAIEMSAATTNIADKLSQYSHLFQQDAIKKFTQLTATEGNKREGTTGEQAYGILGDLEAELDATLATLQEQEIHAAFALAKWISDSGAEVTWLRNELERRQGGLEKLETQLPAVLASQAKSLKLVKNSNLAIQAAMNDLEEKREFYASETVRRNEENAIIDLVIQLFKDQVRSMASKTSLNR